MSTAVVLRRALFGIARVHSQRMVVHMIPMHVMQMAVVQVICVPLMLDGSVAAAGAVLVPVIAVRM